MAAMDPAIWHHLPVELLYATVEHCDRETLMSWSCTSKAFHELSSNVLWETIKINTDNLCRRRNRPHHPFPSIRYRCAKQPWQRVKEIQFDLDDQSLVEESVMRGIFERMAHAMLETMPGIRRCHVEGPVFDQFWKHVTEIASLRFLKMRTQDDYIELFGGEEVEDFEQDGKEWARSQTLDLQRLLALHNLTKLSIGRLTTKEAPGLAEAISKLPNLSSVSISAGASADNDNDVRSIFAGTHGESPIFEFLASLWKIISQRAAVTGSFSGCIPLAQSLKRLKLSDKFRIGQRRSDHDHLLLDTVQQFQSLMDLDLVILRPKALQPFLSLAKLPALEHFSIAGCRHFFSVNTWARMGVHLSETEPHISSSMAPSFEGFLGRHRKTLSSVTLNRGSWLSQLHPDRDLNFSRKDMECLLDPSVPFREVKHKNWEDGRWDTCGGYEGKTCIENNETQRLTLGLLEDLEDSTGGHGSSGEG
ncbi:MAG: hypothetical protein Q9169_006773 [Polycauliona sp. 2 TL-2023]